MQIRWLDDFTPLHVWAKDEGWLGDPYEREFLKLRHQDLAFGAFIKNECVGVITGALHVKSAWISHFIVNPQYRNRGIGRGLFEHLLKILQNERSEIWLHAACEMVPFYSKYGFKKVQTIQRYSYENQTSFYFEPYQFLEKPRLTQKIHELDTKAFKENRKEYLKHSFAHPSSLVLANLRGFLHSRMMDKKYLFIGPFVAEDYENANYLLKGLLFYRGSKPMVVDLNQNSQAAELFESFGFQPKGQTIQMVKNQEDILDYEKIYAYGSTGVWG